MTFTEYYIVGFVSFLCIGCLILGLLTLRAQEQEEKKNGAKGKTRQKCDCDCACPYRVRSIAREARIQWRRERLAKRRSETSAMVNDQAEVTKEPAKGGSDACFFGILAVPFVLEFALTGLTMAEVINMTNWELIAVFVGTLTIAGICAGRYADGGETNC